MSSGPTTVTKVMIQTAGIHPTCNGPQVPKFSVILSADKLVNPYPYVKNLSKKEAIEKTKEIIKKKNNKLVNKLISKGKDSILMGRNVVVLCKFGRHRSRAIAELIGSNYPNRVYYVHQES